MAHDRHVVQDGYPSSMLADESGPDDLGDDPAAQAPSTSFSDPAAAPVVDPA